MMSLLIGTGALAAWRDGASTVPAQAPPPVAEVDAADEVADAAVDDAEPPEAVGAVARGGVMVVWTHQRLWLSRDDGRSFITALDGPGVLGEVTVDGRGRVFALRRLEPPSHDEDSPARWMLGMRQGTREAFRTVDFVVDDDDVPSLVGNGDIVAIAGLAPGDHNEGQLAVTTDGGETWRFTTLAIGGSWEGVAAMNVDARGVVRVWARWGDCTSDGSTLLRVDAATGSRHATEIDAYPQGEAVLGSGQWTYGTDGTCPGLCAWREGDEEQVLRAGDDDEDAPYDSLVSDGSVAYTLRSGEILRLERGRETSMARGVAMDVALTLDDRGRILGLRGSRELVRWSAHGGVERLPAQPLKDDR